MKKILTRSGIALVTVAVVVAGAAAFSAYEAHIVNVTATIDNATDISTSALTFGDVFPQEVLHQPVTLSLSKSFVGSGAAGVDYVIKQKPKCSRISPTGELPQYATVTENSDGVFSCPQGYSMMPLLCPYLSKTSPTPGDTSVPAFHGPLTGWTDRTSVDTQAVGHLTQQTPSTKWDIDLHVPCFKGECAQDWASYVHEANPQANPNAYMADIENKGEQMGCDLWYELTNVIRTSRTVKVGANDLFSGTIPNALGSGKWFMYNDTTDVIDNTLGSFVAGPSTPPHGTGSVAFTLATSPNDRKNIATYQFSGTALSAITQMSFGAYSHSGVAGSSESPYLNFNVDFNNSNTWQKRLVYVPSANGSVPQNSWNSYDVISGGTAMWTWSGFASNGNKWPDNNTNEYRSWNDIKTAFPSARILPTGGWLGVRVGEPGPSGYTGNVDFFSIATGGIPTVYDFEN